MLDEQLQQLNDCCHTGGQASIGKRCRRYLSAVLASSASHILKLTTPVRLFLSLGVEIRGPGPPATNVVPDITRNPPALAVIDHFTNADTALAHLTGRPLSGLAALIGNCNVAPSRYVRDKHLFKPWRSLTYLLHLKDHVI
jgi:hypothetical protein